MVTGTVRDDVVRRILTLRPIYLLVLGTGLATLLVTVAGLLHRDDARQKSLLRLTAAPWHCEVADPTNPDLISSVVESYLDDGVLRGHARLEDRSAGRLLLEFRYQGHWSLQGTALTEAVSDYQYLHVDGGLFPDRTLADIGAEFSEPDLARIVLLTDEQLVYAVERDVYRCGRPDALSVAAAVVAQRLEAP
ncbi:MAG: hypothetical protein R3E86_15725 [Pseudomonadales bacterium]